MIASAVRQKVEALGLQPGTHPENLAAFRLHQWGHRDFVQQHRVGRYRLDFAWISVQVALEVDGPHHGRPDVAFKDAYRDRELRERGWIVLRVDVGDGLEAQLARASLVIHALKEQA